MVSPLDVKAKELAADLRQRITFEPAGSKYILRLADDSRIHEVLEGELRPVLEAFDAQAARIAELERALEPFDQMLRDVEAASERQGFIGPPLDTEPASLYGQSCTVGQLRALRALSKEQADG